MDRPVFDEFEYIMEDDKLRYKVKPSRSPSQRTNDHHQGQNSITIIEVRPETTHLTPLIGMNNIIDVAHLVMVEDLKSSMILTKISQ